MPLGSLDRWPEDYERGRPGWPEAVATVPGLPRTANVLELGAGTGKLTRLLVSAFDQVVALEPADAMRRVLEERLRDANAVAGTAEDIPLRDDSVDVVFVAEAFHRFEYEPALLEVARVLRPGGALVLMWNLPAGLTEPSIAEVERFLSERVPEGDLGYDPLDLGSTRYTSGEWRGAFAAAPFEPLRELCLPNLQTVDRDGLASFFASMGWLADLADEERLPIVEQVRSLLTASEYRRPWETHVHWTRLATKAGAP